MGFIKHELHTTTKAAEALTENAKLAESAKLMFNEHVFVQEPEFDSEDEDNEEDAPEGNGVASQESFRLFDAVINSRIQTEVSAVPANPTVRIISGLHFESSSGYTLTSLPQEEVEL